MSTTQTPAGREPAPGEAAATIAFELDGRPIEAHAGETILAAAARHGVEIPRLCHYDGYRPDGNCRACVVEIEGERVLAPSCCRAPAAGMKVRASGERARASQRMVLELLLADTPAGGHREDSELAHWARVLGVTGSRFAPREQPAPDLSHPAIAVRLDACIQCGRCVRACREEQVNDVIGYAGRGEHARIVFDCEDPMGASSCVGCGECVQACPTGALMPRLLGAGAAAGSDPVRAAPRASQRKVDSLCPFCGVGCQLTWHVSDNRIVYVEGRDGPANHGRLCVKGRFGFDYVASPDRLTVPLVRRPGAAKNPRFGRVPSDWREQFREASWEEALELAGGGLARIRDLHGASALAGFGSAKGSNEEAYLFQKLVRTGFGTNNVDHCTRLCHASSVAALLEGIGSGAVSNPVSDVAHAEVVFLIGSNPTVNHPVAATWIKNAVRRGTKLVLADPRRTELARHATHVLQFRSDTDVALLNALLHTIIAEDLVDREFVTARTSGFEALRDAVARCSPEAMAPVCGIDAATIREVARLFARSRASMILWGMGVSQHVHGTDNARCLIALALLTGQIGRPGTGLHPLRGQNNVQGASDAGLIPMMLPDYRRVDNEAAAAAFEELWGAKIDRHPGLTVVETLQAAAAHRIRAMYVMGENPAMSDPDAGHAREALAALDLLVVQDIFPTETAILADVILPASAFPEKTGSFTNTDRMVQLGRRALDPPGQARQDLWIIVQLARRLGLDWRYEHPREVFEEMRRGMASIRGIDWARLEREGSVTYPCVDENDPGQPVVFVERFPTADGRARLMQARSDPSDEQPDEQWPFVLITGRQLEHWHTGAMSRRAQALDAIEPEATASLHPDDIGRLGLRPGDHAAIASRRGRIVLRVREDDGVAPGSVFVPFAYAEAAANLLTKPTLDPFGKIPGFKYCAVSVSPAPAAQAGGA
ncbi:MAG: formate dehydrogenase subunit alpha [Lautropia sp.]|nr:MAG: formate dehydrogenase subunit alpha [Pseudomonadota bacterium]MBC6960909.1 formate dehydrogenase subunit alpha [Lautropia sp.]MCL4702553.1 formate dehydrogenase subunit alpha [Burkholderiaceae bacterium]MDL1908971.1 formate dehydrogenase subunit alpha [Betaproteobacteria bacterium PRO1]RIK86679.1 MAG: formate dehydrogenase subunit alpha [Burkholderiales bacterium]